MSGPRRTAVVGAVLGAVALSVGAGVLVQTAAPAPATAPAVTRPAAWDGEAQFTVPLYVTPPPTGVLPPDAGSTDEDGVLGPEDVVVPGADPTPVPRAVVRPA